MIYQRQLSKMSKLAGLANLNFWDEISLQKKFFFLHHSQKSLLSVESMAFALETLLTKNFEFYSTDTKYDICFEHKGFKLSALESHQLC